MRMYEKSFFCEFLSKFGHMLKSLSEIRKGRDSKQSRLEKLKYNNVKFEYFPRHSYNNNVVKLLLDKTKTN